jgi:hypothetical protein
MLLAFEHGIGHAIAVAAAAQGISSNGFARRLRRAGNGRNEECYC